MYRKRRFKKRYTKTGRKKLNNRIVSRLGRRL